MVSPSIPIENIYFLLSYAWDSLPEAELTGVRPDASLRLHDLFARLLVGGVTHLLKRGLQREYAAVSVEQSSIRGRLEISESVKHASFERSRAWCSYDELGPDTPANRILKTTLRELARVEGLDPRLAAELREVYRRVPGVSEIVIDSKCFRRFTLGSQARFYRFLLTVCELIHENLFVHEQTGETRFRDFTRDDKKMRKLFERFLFRFYEKEQIAYSVDRPRLKWAATGSPDALARLPDMRTDIVLRSDTATIVADAKFYAETLTTYFDKRSIRSEHLYQLTAYLRHVARPSSEVRGLLIYPRTTEDARIDVTLEGFPVRIATVNLAQAPATIRRELLSLIDS